MRAFVIKRSDIDRCPAKRLDVEHYREDGSCGCVDAVRVAMLAAGQPAANMAATDGPTWDSAGLKAEYEVLGFSAPFVVVRRRADGVVGSLEFTHQPRVYFDFVPDRKDDK